MLFSGIIAALTSLLIPIIILLLLLPNACYVVEQQHAVIIERLGKVQSYRQRGLPREGARDRPQGRHGESAHHEKNGFGIDVKTRTSVTIRS